MLSDAGKRELLRAVARKRRVDEEYLETIEDLLRDRVTYADLAAVLGVTRQAVQQYVSRERRKT